MTEHRHSKVSVTSPDRLLVREQVDASIERALAEADRDEEVALAEEGMADWSELVRRDPV